MTDKSIHAIVSGKVQRVYYRASLQREAARLGLRGFVRNLPDGRVEFEATGPDNSVEELLQWSRTGPPMADVSDVVVIPEAADQGAGGFDEFVILR